MIDTLENKLIEYKGGRDVPSYEIVREYSHKLFKKIPVVIDTMFAVGVIGTLILYDFYKGGRK